jgi:hypothetical protein
MIAWLKSSFLSMQCTRGTGSFCTTFATEMPGNGHYKCRKHFAHLNQDRCIYARSHTMSQSDSEVSAASCRARCIASERACLLLAINASLRCS